jgi:hypothetical protein
VRRDHHLRPPCPASARLACWLLLTVAVLAALDTALAGLALRHLTGATETFLAQPNADDQVPQLLRLHGDYLYDALLAAATGVALALLGVAILRPWRYARGVSLGCAGLLILALPLGYAVSTQDAPTIYPADPRVVQEATANLVLSWYPSWRLLSMVVEVTVLLIAVHELLTSEAHDYYRKLRADGQPGLWSFIPHANR